MNRAIGIKTPSRDYYKASVIEVQQNSKNSFSHAATSKDVKRDLTKTCGRISPAMVKIMDRIK